MHAYLITGTHLEKVNEEIVKLVKKLNAQSFEFSIQKIGEVRELNKFLSLSQLERILIILRNVEEASTESLNAFLKKLEEPGENVFFVLTTSNESKVLPTIVSRCQVIHSSDNSMSVSNKLGREFISANVAEKLKTIEKYKKRDEAISFIKELINSLHTELISAKDNHLHMAQFIKKAQKTLDALNQNGNVTIQLTNFIASLT